MSRSPLLGPDGREADDVSRGDQPALSRSAAECRAPPGKPSTLRHLPLDQRFRGRSLNRTPRERAEARHDIRSHIDCVATSGRPSGASRLARRVPALAFGLHPALTPTRASRTRQSQDSRKSQHSQDSRAAARLHERRRTPRTTKTPQSPGTSRPCVCRARCLLCPLSRCRSEISLQA